MFGDLHDLLLRYFNVYLMKLLKIVVETLGWLLHTSRFLETCHSLDLPEFEIFFLLLLGV